MAAGTEGEGAITMSKPKGPPPPERKDTANDARFVGFREVGWSENGRWIRLIFVGKDKVEYPVQILSKYVAVHACPAVLESRLRARQKCALRWR
jgi:hypothetical protein